MNDFSMYFSLGRRHIADLNGYDHILFITALCLTYGFRDWRKVLVLVTAFTIGHSITLALSTLHYIWVPTHWIEFLIPVTIMVTALTDIIRPDPLHQGKFPLIYYYALFFGLIHGMGFANGLRSLLGRTENIIVPLFAFNVGLEVGQLLIVAIALSVSFVFVRFIRVPARNWQLFVAGGIFGLALEMAITRFPI
jgi:hypothetical protein